MITILYIVFIINVEDKNIVFPSLISLLNYKYFGTLCLDF